MKKFSLIIAFFTIAIFFYACTEDEELPKEDTTTSQDYSLADNLFGSVTDVSDQAEKGNDNYLEGGKIGGTYLGNCVTISFDSVLSSSTNKITIDFGTLGCIGGDGRTRKGKVFIEYQGFYRDSGTVILTTFENYFVDDYQLIGSHNVTNMGKNSLDQTHFNIDIDGEVVKPNSGGVIKYVSQRTRTWVEGEDTDGIVLGWVDDVYEITGTANGKNSAGLDYEVVITNPLEVALICRWVRSGTIEVRPAGLATRIFDFGDGACDAKASVTVNNITINFFMP